MENIESLLGQYFLLFDNLPKTDEECRDNDKDICDLHTSVTCEENWKIFFETSFDCEQIKLQFNSKLEEERSKIFKFGIACLINFVRGNFTGPEFDSETEIFLGGTKFKNTDFRKLLAVNNEDINVNTRYLSLLVAAKLIFEWCPINTIINIWWYWRSVIVHQQVFDELSPTLLSDADRLYKHIQVNTNVKGHIKALLDIEVAQLYLLFHHVSKAKEHIMSASEILGIHYKLVGALGKRTKYQEKDIAQLFLKVTIECKNGFHKSEENSDLVVPKDIPLNDDVREENSDLVVPKDIPLNDDVRLNTVKFCSNEGNETVCLTNTEQKLFVVIIQEMLIARPRDELYAEELQPFIDLILNQKNSFSVRVIALLLRCKLESKHRRTIERSLAQCEEIVGGFKKQSPHFLSRVVDVFSTGLPPMWKVESQHADLLLNIGLVKNALDIYLNIKLWEEVIVCYTILKLRHKAAEVIREQLNIKPTVKLLCLLGDATDDVTCYEKAWEMSKRRSHRAQRHWGQYFFLRKEYDKCIPHFEKSVSINPLQANVWLRLGFAALHLESWQTAATAYRRYTTLEPDGFEAWNNLAQAYIKIGNKRNAHQALLEALKFNFENWKIWENLLVVSCDISNFADVIRAYHKLLDIKEKYLNVEVLNVLVFNVCHDANDCEGQPSQRFLKQTRELLGRVTAIYPGEGYLWELYADLAPAILLRAQRLQRAYRGYTQGAWEKNPDACQHLLYTCSKLADIVLSNEIDPKDSLTNSIRLNLCSAVTAIKRQDWEKTREAVETVSSQLEKITEKLKTVDPIVR